MQENFFLEQARKTDWTSSAAQTLATLAIAEELSKLNERIDEELKVGGVLEILSCLRRAKPVHTHNNE
jgi:hypothetical protein